MGLSRKRLKKTTHDLEEFDDLRNENLTMKERHYVVDDDDDDNGNDDDDDFDGEEDTREDEEEELESEEDNHRDAEMEDLEKEYMDLRNQELDVLKNLKRHKDEDRLKGQAVKNQKALWDKALEFRFLLQKPFSSSNRLPLESTRSSFCDSDGEVNAAYSDLISSSKKTLVSLMELQEALIEKNPSISQLSNANYGKSAKGDAENADKLKNKDDAEWLELSELYRRLASYRDKSIDKWQRKTQVTSGSAAIKGRLQAFNQNISEQVAAYMRDPSRMVKQMQLRRSNIDIFGPVSESKEFVSGEEAQVGDSELLDDSEFYQQLLKEFFETIDPNSPEVAFYALKRLHTKKRKVVDRRASKSRKIRYNVHEKIVNFMAPQPMNIPTTAEKLFEDLFGLKTPKLASKI